MGPRPSGILGCVLVPARLIPPTGGSGGGIMLVGDILKWALHFFAVGGKVSANVSLPNNSRSTLHHLHHSALSCSQNFFFLLLV